MAPLLPSVLHPQIPFLLLLPIVFAAYKFVLHCIPVLSNEGCLCTLLLQMDTVESACRTLYMARGMMMTRASLRPVENERAQQMNRTSKSRLLPLTSRCIAVHVATCVNYDCLHTHEACQNGNVLAQLASWWTVPDCAVLCCVVLRCAGLGWAPVATVAVHAGSSC